MLRDLLFALHGFSGSIIKENDNGVIKIVPGLPNLSPSEEISVNNLLHLATRLTMFEKFIKNNMNIPSCHSLSGNYISSDGLKPGCYLMNFCAGLKIVLTDYKTVLVNVEKEILKDPHLSFLYIQQMLESYHVLFNALFDVLNTIKMRKSHGCQILDVLFRASRNGNTFVKSTMLSIMKHCHIVMYKQLAAWLLHGLLLDKHGEFFIVLNNQTSEAEVSEEYWKSSPCHDSFDMNLEFLPSYIPQNVASVILFIGSSLHLFDFSEDDAKLPAIASNESELSSHNWKLKSLLKAREEDFMINFQKLQKSEEFSIERFETLIDSIRSVVAKDLWRLCVKNAQLVSTLCMLKDFYLLGRGELFLAFIEEADVILKCPPTAVTEHDVQHAFIRAAAKVHIEDSTPFQLFKLTLQPESEELSQYPFVKTDIIDNGWSRLGLSFQVKWPLQTLFKPHILGKYNQLFRFLLRVRRAQAALQQIWILQMRDDQNENDKLRWRCRSEMQYFVDNLQYYLQADVLESHFTNLLNKISSNDDAHQDFEAMLTAHENFLNALLAQCFISSHTVCKSLIGILDICQQFCDVVLTSNLTVSKQSVSVQIEKLWKSYSDNIFMFFQVLTGICSNQCNPHIAQLTLRMDYNKYFTSTITRRKDLPGFNSIF